MAAGAVLIAATKAGAYHWADCVCALPPLTMEIYLLRHAESTSNKANMADSQIDADLSPEGTEVSESLVGEINKIQPDVLFVSPLKRTQQTIQPFLDTQQDPVVVESDLLLERDLGKFTGTPMGAFQEYCKENNLDKVTTRPEGGESLVDVYEKTKLFLQEIKDTYPDQKVLVCGGQNNLMCLQIAIEGNNIADYYSFESFKTGELRRFKI